MPLGLLGLVLCALFIAADRRERASRTSSARSRRSRRGLDRAVRAGAARPARCRCSAASAVGALTLAIALGLWRPKLELQELGPIHVERVRYDFLENIWRASANIQYREADRRACARATASTCRDEHGNLDNERYVASSPATIKEYMMVRCIRARPSRTRVLNIDVPARAGRRFDRGLLRHRACRALDVQAASGADARHGQRPRRVRRPDAIRQPRCTGSRSR